MKHPVSRWLLAMIVCSVPAVSALAQAGASEQAWPARVGRLVPVQGVAWVFERDEGAWIQAQTNRPLTTGDRISTDAGSRVELHIGSTTLRLGGDTDLGLRQLDDRAMSIDLEAGSLALRVASGEVLAQIDITTPEGRFSPRTTGHFRIDRRDHGSEATAWRGVLEFQGRDSRLTIEAGQRAELWLQGPAQTTHYRWGEVERDDFFDWTRHADREAERSETARHVSTEMTGWEDLDRHGRWSAHPEYGQVWMPTQVPVGWAPYVDGRWVWVLPWGWTWVDAAPWGFAPFHYGRWVRWGGRWVWTPGPRTAHPVFAPALVSWTITSTHGVGQRPPPPVRWAPLGPREVYRPHRHVVPSWPRDRVVTVPPPPRAQWRTEPGGGSRPTPRGEAHGAPDGDRRPAPDGDDRATPRDERRPPTPSVPRGDRQGGGDDRDPRQPGQPRAPAPPATPGQRMPDAAPPPPEPVVRTPGPASSVPPTGRPWPQRGERPPSRTEPATGTGAPPGRLPAERAPAERAPAERAPAERAPAERGPAAVPAPGPATTEPAPQRRRPPTGVPAPAQPAAVAPAAPPAPPRAATPAPARPRADDDDASRPGRRPAPDAEGEGRKRIPEDRQGADRKPRDREANR